jgi:KDO2-lipid IV(A) lauroyltransferase
MACGRDAARNPRHEPQAHGRSRRRRHAQARPAAQEHRIGRDNLAAAFPEKSAAEIETILDGVWDNLRTRGGRIRHIDRLQMFEPDPDDLGDILYSIPVYDRFRQLRDDGKPALIFAAHLGNWELPALVASKYRLDTTVLYRRPNIGAVSDAIIQIRKGSMGTLVPTGLDARPSSCACSSGGHVAMLVDQHYVNGVGVTFFGRRCRRTRSSRGSRAHVCAIHGTRVVRLPDRHRFQIDLTEAIEAGPRRRGQDRHRRHHAGDHVGGQAGYASTRSSGCGCTGAGADARAHFPVLIRSTAGSSAAASSDRGR